MTKKRFFVVLVLALIGDYLLGGYKGNIVTFVLYSVLGTIVILGLMTLSNKVAAKWGSKNVLFRKIF